MISFKFDSKFGVKKASARLKRSAKKIDTLVVPMKKISILLDRWVQLNFRSEGGKVGKWKKLKAGGRFSGKGKQRRFDPTAKVLKDTGALRISFKPFSSKSNAGIGSELPYSKVHERGLNGMKKRRMLPDKSDSEVNKFVESILGSHIMKSFKK